MKQIVGLALIAFGMLAGASAASVNMRNEKAGMPAAERFGEALGGACCSLSLAVPGFVLALSGGKKKGDGKYRPPSQLDREPGSEPASYPARPGAAEPPPRVVGADGKIPLTCMACYADVRVEVPHGVKVVDCPKCGHEIRVVSS